MFCIRYMWMPQSARHFTWIPPLTSTIISVPKLSAFVLNAVALQRRRCGRFRGVFDLTGSAEGLNAAAAVASAAASAFRGTKRGPTAKQDTEIGNNATRALHRSLIARWWPDGGRRGSPQMGSW